MCCQRCKCHEETCICSDEDYEAWSKQIEEDARRVGAARPKPTPEQVSALLDSLKKVMDDWINK